MVLFKKLLAYSSRVLSCSSLALSMANRADEQFSAAFIVVVSPSPLLLVTLMSPEPGELNPLRRQLKVSLRKSQAEFFFSGGSSKEKVLPWVWKSLREIAL
jgi:hypothetical protein